MQLGQGNDALLPTFLQYVVVVWVVLYFVNDCTVFWVHSCHKAPAGRINWFC